MNCEIISLGPIEANCTIVWGEEKKAWIIDPGAQGDKVISFLKANGLEPALIIVTHGHFDHIGGIPELQKAYEGLCVHIAKEDEQMLGHPQNLWEPYYPMISKPSPLKADLDDGVVITEGGIAAKIIATPGHTPGGVCVHFESENILVSGDTLFAGSCGRTDFPGGDARVLRESLLRLAKLPTVTKVIPGHGSTTTIEIELATNPYLR
ncbi:MAG: MBL fold metallo-hydrolase [Kiritimatiellae bacterium]|nr:MBL fold metallo-hydrolase [Kiritimatiellia bacterium]